MTEYAVMLVAAGFWFSYVMGLMAYGTYLQSKNGAGKGRSL